MRPPRPTGARCGGRFRGSRGDRASLSAQAEVHQGAGVRHSMRSVIVTGGAPAGARCTGHLAGDREQALLLALVQGLRDPQGDRQAVDRRVPPYRSRPPPRPRRAPTPCAPRHISQVIAVHAASAAASVRVGEGPASAPPRPARLVDHQRMAALDLDVVGESTAAARHRPHDFGSSRSRREQLGLVHVGEARHRVARRRRPG